VSELLADFFVESDTDGNGYLELSELKVHICIHTASELTEVKAHVYIASKLTEIKVHIYSS
jgi:hypothetical protein